MKMSWWNAVTYLDCLIIAVLILVTCYIALTWNYDYFAKRGIPFRKPLPLFGNNARLTFRLQSLADFTKDYYDSFPGSQVIGIYQFLSPTFWVKDPNLLKSITVKDFDHFTDHLNFIPDNVDPLLAANLFTLKGQRWKNMRSLLSPAFTSSKMKGMFHLITECAQQLVDYLDAQMKDTGKDILEMDMKDLFSKFTNDVIATSAFGISCNSLNNPTNEFYKCGKDLLNFKGSRFLIFLGYLLFPKLMEMMQVRLIKKSSGDFLYKTVKQNIEIREKNGIIRPDMIHLLMQARKGELRGEEEEETKQTAKATHQKHDLSDTDITAQAAVFFLAGFDTASVLLGFASVLLATRQDVQKRLQEEIDKTMEECNGKITYDILQNMRYLDMVISETLRIYPPISILDRECVKPYTIPPTENTPAINLKPKDILFIPVYGFHHDPVYFPEPEKFDPERFSYVNKPNIKPFTYMPFGLGPRSCIGNRFVLMEDKIALVYLLSRFSLHVIPKSPVPIKLSAASTFDMKPEKGFWIGLKKR